MLDFMSNLENNPYPPYRLIEIESLNIKRLGEKSLVRLERDLPIGDLETVLEIKIYVQ